MYQGLNGGEDYVTAGRVSDINLSSSRGSGDGCMIAPGCVRPVTVQASAKPEYGTILVLVEFISIL